MPSPVALRRSSLRPPSIQRRDQAHVSSPAPGTVKPTPLFLSQEGDRPTPLSHSRRVPCSRLSDSSNKGSSPCLVIRFKRRLRPRSSCSRGEAHPCPLSSREDQVQAFSPAAGAVKSTPSSPFQRGAIPRLPFRPRMVAFSRLSSRSRKGPSPFFITHFTRGPSPCLFSR